MVARILRPLGLLTVLISFSALSARADLSVCQANGLLIGSVANKPFTAEVRIASWQLSNGNREDMRVARIMKVARDSSGRVMVLFPQRWASDEARDSGGQPIHWQTTICDPLNGLYTVVSAKQTPDANLSDISSGSVEAWIAVQHGLPRRTASDPKPFDGPHLSTENFKVEDLRVTTVEGVSGHRFRAWRISDGSPSGDYVEQAFSKDIELEVAKIDVKGNIAHGVEYVRLDSGEPNPELFLIPATYKVVAVKELPPP
jgi:hypothetical protein